MNASPPPGVGGHDARVREISGTTLYLCDSVGPTIGSAQDAVDIIGQSWHSRAALIVIPAERLDDRFFTLRTGLAGELLQKFVNYELSIAVVGDISAHLEASSALRAFVHESNNGRQVWFLGDLDQLDERLTN